MTRIEWTTRAADELKSIRDYIALDSEQHACLVVERILAAVDGIGDFPEAGSIVPEFHNADIREKIVHRYRIIYQLREGTIQVVQILAIIHGSRRLNDI